MSNSQTSRIEGVESASQVLRGLPIKIEERVLQQATSAGARRWARYIRAAAPIGPETPNPDTKRGKQRAKYGLLKRNIRTKASKRDKRRHQRGAYVTTGNAFWGYFREVGTRHQPPLPWFRPAANRGYQAALTAMRDRLPVAIEKEAEKLARRFRSNR